MKKLYTILLALLLGGFLAVGIWSLVDTDVTFSAMDNRVLAKKPTFSLSALMDGSYISQLETYYSDTFPARDTLLKLNKQLNGFYHYSGKGEDNLLVLDYKGGAENGGESLHTPDTAPIPSEKPSEPTAPEELPVSGTPTEPETPPITELPAEPQTPEKPEDTPASEQTEQPKPPQEPETDPDYASCGNIIVVGTNAMDIPTATESIIVNYAHAINNLSEALGSSVRTISLVTPNSGQFYSPKDFHTGLHDQKAMIDLCYSSMNKEIVTVDAFSALSPHKDEYIYFRTDHHWTALGAYYAYTAFCETLGLDAVDLSEFQTGAYEGFVGSMYTFTSGYPQSQVLKDNPDTLTYYLPLVETHARYYADADLEHSTAYPTSVVYQSLDASVSNKYMCFLGGDHPVTVVTADNDGPVCMVLKESYGNAFVPFLTNHYSKIVVVDPREFNRDGKPSLDLTAFAKEQGVSDLIVINYPFMISNQSYVNWLNRLVGIDQ